MKKDYEKNCIVIIGSQLYNVITPSVIVLADQNKADWSYDENAVINIYDDANFEDGRLHMTFEQFFKLAQIAREEGLEIHSPFERAGGLNLLVIQRNGF